MRPDAISNAIRQHLETADFFGKFFVRSATPEKEPTDSLRDSASSDLEAIAGQVRACCKCGLEATRQNAVPGEGCAHARLMFVGEAPGADEDAQGRPFVGRAGQLLTKIIKACTLDRSQVFITNTIKCRPPQNRDPHPDEIVRCLPYLQAQIRTIRPEVIVALGAHAARTLLNTNESIGRLRGRFHAPDIEPDGFNVKVMATYHPAYLLRYYTQENRKRVWEDMKKVMRELNISLPAGD